MQRGGNDVQEKKIRSNNGVNEGVVHWNAKTAFSFTPSSILT